MHKKLKYRIAGFLLLLASTVWLVNTVFPHHHHNLSVCFNSHHCHPHESDGHDNPANGADEHGHDHGQDHCTLNLPATVPLSATNFLSHNFSNSDTKFSLYKVQAVISYFLFAFPCKIKESSGYIAQAPPICCVSPNDHVHGLRAPPTV